MAFLTVTAAAAQAETGSAIGNSFSAELVGDQTNRETWNIANDTEVEFVFTPVPTGKASFLVIRFYGLVDPGTGEPLTKVTWGYTTGFANHEHELALGDSSVVRLNPAKAQASIFIHNPDNTVTPTAVWVEAQVWEE